MKHLKAWLRPNVLTPDQSDFLAVPVTNGSLTEQDIINALQQEGMEIKTETALDIVTRFNRKAAEMLCNGYNVNTGLVYMRPAIKGVFYDKTWDNEKNSLYASINQGSELRKVIAETKVEILGEATSPMSIFSITDLVTGATDGTLTKGKNAEIKGTYIKIAGTSPDNGIVFRNVDNSKKVKLKPEEIVLNEPSRLLILVPAKLPKGTYELSVTTQSSTGTTLLKEPRTEVLAVPVVIA